MCVCRHGVAQEPGRPGFSVLGRIGYMETVHNVVLRIRAADAKVARNLPLSILRALPFEDRPRTVRG